MCICVILQTLSLAVRRAASIHSSDPVVYMCADRHAPWVIAARIVTLHARAAGAIPPSATATSRRCRDRARVVFKHLLHMHVLWVLVMSAQHKSTGDLNKAQPPALIKRSPALHGSSSFRCMRDGFRVVSVALISQVTPRPRAVHTGVPSAVCRRMWQPTADHPGDQVAQI